MFVITYKHETLKLWRFCAIFWLFWKTFGHKTNTAFRVTLSSLIFRGRGGFVLFQTHRLIQAVSSFRTKNLGAKCPKIPAPNSNHLQFLCHLPRSLRDSPLAKFIQKIDPNWRMPRIFMDSVDKSAFYIRIPMYFHIIFCYD